MDDGNAVLESILLIFITSSIAVILYVFFANVKQVSKKEPVMQVDTLIKTIEVRNDSAINLTYTVDSLSGEIRNHLELIEYYKQKEATILKKLKEEYEINKDSIKHIASDSELVRMLRSRVR